MNENPSPAPICPPYFRPGFFLAGLAAGLAGLVWWGHATTGRSHYREFTRIHPVISPEGSYYPTVDELRALVRAQCRPDQVLVVVGGNSVFNGVGQPAAEVWTRHLQAELGARFAVVNLALRGGYALEGAALIAESLRDEFPRTVLVTNTSPFKPSGVLGSDTYRFLFWEAWQRGLLVDTPARRAAVADYRNKLTWAQRVESTGMGWLDRVTRHRDLWNRVGMETIFTVPSFYTPGWPGMFRARGDLPDNENDFNAMSFDSPHRFAADKDAVEMRIVRAFSSEYYAADDRGGWILHDWARTGLLKDAKDTVPEALRARTMIALSRNSPHYLKKLTPTERVRENLAYRQTVETWQEAGFAAVEYGADYAKEDYGDRTHLTSTGGRKLAAELAPQIARLAEKLGYLK
jgi:hypothetical protein